MTTAIEPAATRLLAAFRADVLHGAPLPCTRIHPDDFMLRFFLQQHHGHWEGALFEYFRSGLGASRVIGGLLHHWFGPSLRDLSVLDFASGFGRVNRWLVQELAPRRVWVSDIFPAAVEFQRCALGVHGFPSTAHPEQLECEETFDCVVASSLFSHLPEETFEPWLRRLFGLLRPGGVLLFSVHDRAIREPAAAPPPGSGFEFDRLSEIPELAADQYGTSWVDEPFVRAAVSAACGASPCVRLPRALWSFQDLYAVGKGRELPSPPRLAHEPVGHLDGASRSPTGRWLSLHGWTHDFRGPGVSHVDIRLDGERVAACPVGFPRDDVARALALPGFVGGFAISVAASGATTPGETYLSLIVVGKDGTEFPLHLGTVEGTVMGLLARDQAKASEVLTLRLRGEEAARIAAEQREAAALTARAEAEGREAMAAESRELLRSEVEVMRQSRFWKLRDAWWSLKGRIRPDS
jgi:SAM-dependent methyltransferase